MIVDVERFGAERKTLRLLNPEGLEQRQIPVLEARLVDGIANALLKIERSRGRRREQRGRRSSW